MLGQPKDYRGALLRLMVPVAVLSPFLNTATVVTMFVSVVKMWSKKVKMAPAKKRSLGGLGIHIIRQNMDSMNYERIDNSNVLTLRKKILKK